MSRSTRPVQLDMFPPPRPAPAAARAPEPMLAVVVAPGDAPGAEMPLCFPSRGQIYLSHAWAARGGCSRCGVEFPKLPALK